MIRKIQETKLHKDLRELLIFMYEYYTEERLEDYEEFGGWLANEIVANFDAPTMPDYSVEDAQDNLNDFIEGFNSVKKKI